MKVEGMKKSFRRSVAERGVRSSYYIGDGDASTFKDVWEKCKHRESLMCGPRTKANGNTSEEAEKDMKRKKLADRKTIGGRGHLTDEIIKEFTTYCGNSIRKN
ncbi:hypothetical protein AVEN_91894-1 [Araneus ventricosus]|uniref:Uncharacterized protein n=1 Tax=Araneus ventricosus TaxID=182803 RepID=A0A4Y2LV35_ARAVE|nr:hypothetical protein AVEN_91894-1 [Araneus ventricosus]